ncbi:MAG: hypothetical protein IIC71_14005 [Acidobacteria bacterium]|nr:hypothetical protein [Acidobacteriota bacterium]
MKLGITGHQNLPPQVITEIKGAIRNLASVEQICLVGSLAVGADQVAAEEVLLQGGLLEVVVPCDRYESIFADGSSLETYQRLIAQATAVSVLPFPEPSEAALMAAGVVVVERSDQVLAAWDGEPSRGLGGNSDVVRYAKREHKPVTNVWPRGLERE